MKFYDRAVFTVIALSLAVLVGNLTFGDKAEADVAGMSYYDLKTDYDFKKAVKAIVESCTVYDSSISC